MLLLLCYFFAQPDCKDYLPEHCNTIIKQKLCGGGEGGGGGGGGGGGWSDTIKKLFKFYFAAIFFAFAPVDAFLLTVVSACFRPCDANNLIK